MTRSTQAARPESGQDTLKTNQDDSKLSTELCSEAARLILAWEDSDELAAELAQRLYDLFNNLARQDLLSQLQTVERELAQSRADCEEADRILVNTAGAALVAEKRAQAASPRSDGVSQEAKPSLEEEK